MNTAAAPHPLLRRPPSSTVQWALRLLPRPQRAAMTALRAYCQELDDIADGPAPLAEKRGRLAAWRRELDALYAGTPATPISLALRDPIRQYGLPRDEFEEIIKSMEMDAAGIMLAPLLCDLRLYCRRSAGATAILALAILGDRGQSAGCFALLLGEAVQLIHRLRALTDDAALGRLYLPREALAEAGIVAASPAEVLSHEALPAVCEEVAAMAEARLREARSMLPDLVPTAAGPARVAVDGHHRLLDRLTARGWRDLDSRPSLGPLELARIALKHRVFGSP